MVEQGETMNVPYYVGENIKVMDGPFFNGFLVLLKKLTKKRKN
jgi:transcriptional antiterminator NusG